MKITLSWLRDFLEFEGGAKEVAAKLTSIGLEVEEIIDRTEEFKPFIVAEILEAEPHPEADKLRYCKVNNGTEVLKIVCGAPNARAGIKVVLAPIGVTIPANGLVIKQAKIRGLDSSGMMCSAAELALGEDSAGIIELPANAEVGKQFAPYMGADDPVIDINITPNRGDALGVYGVARDLAAAGFGTLKPEKYTNEAFQELPAKEGADSKIKVAINDQDCGFFIGCTISGVKNTESPQWLQKRLKSIGQKSISALVDITNYFLHTYGRPSHVYDAAKLKGGLTARKAKSGEKLLALDGKEYELNSDMLVIADDAAPVAIAGVIGGEPTSVNLETSEVFLEVALFNPNAVAQTGRKLQINTDSRFRFERFVAPSTLKYYLAIVDLITEICGGTASKPTIAGKIDVERKQVSFRPSRVKEITGVEVADNRMQEIVEKIGCKHEKSASTWLLGISSYRPDITLEEDVVEEILRLVGYDNIPDTPLPPITNSKPRTLQQERLEIARSTLAARGSMEGVHYSFISPKLAENFGSKVKLANPISAELSVLRSSIIPSLIDALIKNQARFMSDLSLFEIGAVFSGNQPAQQSTNIAGIRSGLASNKNPLSEARNFDAYDVKADVLAVLSQFMNTDNLQYNNNVPNYYHPGRSSALALGNKVLAVFGELHPSVLKDLDIKTKVQAFEIYPEHIPVPKKTGNSKPLLHLNLLLNVTRDFAFVVDESVSAANIIIAVRKAEKDKLKAVNIFDIYSGDKIEAGKKSVALTVTLEPKDKSFTDAEIDEISGNIISSVFKSVGGVLRS